MPGCAYFELDVRLIGRVIHHRQPVPGPVRPVIPEKGTIPELIPGYDKAIPRNPAIPDQVFPYTAGAGSPGCNDYLVIFVPEYCRFPVGQYLFEGHSESFVIRIYKVEPYLAGGFPEPDPEDCLATDPVGRIIQFYGKPVTEDIHVTISFKVVLS